MSEDVAFSNEEIGELIEFLRKEGLDPCDDAADLIESQAAELEAIRERVKELQDVVNQQAEDGGIWFEATTAPEAYLQQQLRRLHEVIEGKTSEECAEALLSTRREEG